MNKHDAARSLNYYGRQWWRADVDGLDWMPDAACRREILRYINDAQAPRIARAVDEAGFAKPPVEQCIGYAANVARNVGGPDEDIILKIIAVELDGFYLDAEGSPVYDVEV